MPRKLCIMACENFERELSAILDSEQFDDVKLILFPALCSSPNNIELVLKKARQAEASCQSIYLLGGTCLSNPDELPRELNRYQLFRMEQCFDLLVGESLIERYLGNGYHLLTPGWLAHWQDYIADWGFDQATAQEFFQESTRMLVLLETGVDDKSREHLEEFAAFVGLPFEVVPIGLDYLRVFISDIVLKWRAENVKHALESHVSMANRQLADYAMVLDLIGGLTGIITEVDAINHILDIFTMLFAPERLLYIPFVGGKPAAIKSQPTLTCSQTDLERLAALQGDHSWTASGKGFLVRIGHKDETLGILEIDEIAFPKHKKHYLNLALAVIRVLALAISNARTYDSLQKALRELDALSEVTDVAISTLDLGELLDSLLMRLVKVMRSDSAVILLRDRDSLVTRASVGAHEEARHGFSVKVGQGFAGTIAQMMQPLYIRDAQQDPRVINPILKKCGVRSMLGAPLISNGEVVGVLHVDWLNIHPEDEQELHLLDAVAERCATAVVNSQLYEQVKELQQSLELQIERMPIGHILWDRQFRAASWNPAAEEIFGYKAKEALGKHPYELIVPGSAQPQVNAIWERLLEGDVTANSINENITKDGRTIICSWQNTPLKKPDGTVVGVLSMIEDITEQKQAEELRGALNDINTTISSTLDTEEILQRIIIEATNALGSESATVALYEGDCWVAKYSYGAVPAELARARIPNEDAIASILAAESKKPVAINDAYEDERACSEVMKRYGIRSMLVVPLAIKERVIGAIYFHHYQAPVEFSDAQVDFAAKLGVSVSLALENARLYNAQRHIADTLQLSLLVMPEQIEGINFGYLYRSATEEAKVGGDFYDIFETSPDKVGIVLGDVSGKGLVAATLTAVVRNTIRAYALEGHPPAEVMARANNAVRAISGQASFVTVFFALLDTARGELVYCSAGHPPALIKRSSGVKLLREHSPLIGAFAGLSYSESKATLGKGDTLILYTDGITEARCEGFYGEERLVELVESLAPLSAKDTIQAVFSDVLKCSGGTLSDDIALLAVSLNRQDSV